MRTTPSFNLLGDLNASSMLCECTSTKPGETTSPVASMREVAGTRRSAPGGATRTIHPPRTATSPAKAGRPVPSTMRPPVMTRSYRSAGAEAGACANEGAEASAHRASATNSRRMWRVQEGRGEWARRSCPRDACPATPGRSVVTPVVASREGPLGAAQLARQQLARAHPASKRLSISAGRPRLEIMCAMIPGQVLRVRCATKARPSVVGRYDSRIPRLKW